MREELQKFFVDSLTMPQDTDNIFMQAKQFQELMMLYNCAIKEVHTKLEVLNDELSIRYQRNPIEVIKTRVKKPLSIANKLKKRNHDISVDSIKNNLHDVAGIRVVCSFIDDIYTLTKMLQTQDDITFLETKDYIKNPKPNGYRSFHIIAEVPVYLTDRKEKVKVEIQIRTIAMDFWASLEHQLHYKNGPSDTQSIEMDLKECADTIAFTDARMQDIQKRIQG